MKTINFNTTSLFPTIIGSCVNVPLSQKVLPFAKEILNNPQNLTDAWWGYKNTYSNENIPRTIVYKELESFILDVSKSFRNTINSEIEPKNVQLFFSEMNYGDFHSYHAHPDSIFSGVFYLNVPENSAFLRLHDARPFNHFISYRPNQPNTDNSDFFYDIKPQTGLFLIWQSWVPHEVLKNLSNGRITVVFNIVF